MGDKPASVGHHFAFRVICEGPERCVDRSKRHLHMTNSKPLIKPNFRLWTLSMAKDYAVTSQSQIHVSESVIKMKSWWKAPSPNVEHHPRGQVL